MNENSGEKKFCLFPTELKFQCLNTPVSKQMRNRVPGPLTVSKTSIFPFLHNVLFFRDLIQLFYFWVCLGF